MRIKFPNVVGLSDLGWIWLALTGSGPVHLWSLTRSAMSFWVHRSATIRSYVIKVGPLIGR